MDTSSDRVQVDCRKIPSENNCSVTIAGKKDEVLPLAIHHAIEHHGHQDTPELRQEVEQGIEPAVV